LIGDGVNNFVQSTGPSLKRICLIGAGSIAQAHAEAIRNIPGLALTVVIDSDGAKARRFAAQWRIEHVYSSISEALGRRNFDRAHVAVPPNVHYEVTLRLLEAFVPTFVEKPLASTTSEAKHLIETAKRCDVSLGVNQNAIFHPAFRKLKDHLAKGDIGQLEHVDSVYNMPLRQLATRQFSHWMFAESKNILLEQAVHPLSQILNLVGASQHVRAMAGKPTEVASGVQFYSSCSVILQGEHTSALVRFAIGASHPMWQIRAVGTDGLITADMIRNRVVLERRCRWLDPIDDLVSGLSAAGQIVRQSLANAMAYVGSISGLGRRTDPFFLSMSSSIAAFHGTCDADGPMPSDGSFGLSLVSHCEQIAETAFDPPAKTRPCPVTRRGNRHDIAVLGGTGFIGRAVVAHLLQQQPTVRIGVMSRNARNLPEVFHEDRVQLIAGDVTSKEDVSNAIDSARLVINLAHGGGGETWQEIKERMVGSARAVASTCASRKTELLIHIGSIAGLYLGNKSEVITGRTLPDPQPHKRAPYARAKAMADELLMEWQREHGLPVCILRPGIVVGDGASPFHSGLGFFNNEQHCMGWNQGRNPLPFVLVDDVADAIVRAAGKSALSGFCLNLVGDVPMTGREYIYQLALVLGRPLRFHGQSPTKLYLAELAKWTLKRFAGGKVAPPSYYDLCSRGCWARFDCSDAKAALNWTPVTDRALFVEKAIHVHVRPVSSVDRRG
jgi:predicted dehydrogenase/nucleoside-diphosphate-sugar epimerase